MKRILALVLLSLMLLPCLMACNPGGTSPDGTTTDSNATSGETTPTPDTPAGELKIVEGGATKYKVVRSDNSTTQVTDAAKSLRAAIIEKYGLGDMSIVTDFESRDANPADRYQFEILVGSTNRDESIAALASVMYNDFIICVSGTRVVIAGHNDQKTTEAVEYFIANYLGGSSLSLSATLSYVEHGSYAAEGLKLLGRPIADYKIVYKNAYKSMALTVADTIGNYSGAVMATGTDSADAVGPEIVIGSTRRGVGTGYGTDDFSLTVKDGSILIGGGSDPALGSGCRYLLNLIAASSGDLDASALTYSYTLPDRDVYINDISKLAMHWDILFDTPDWMLDFDKKVAAMSDPAGRLMSCLHRGDMVYYPENSIEGIISAIRMGADMVEIDPRRTKDGVLVLMHDETLTRMTNASEFAGKNGFPTSMQISEWTFEQLRQLSLKEGTGGDSAKLTTYKIPTLDEVMKVCSERIMVRLDKLDQWSYVDDIWPLIVKYKAYTTVIFTWHSAYTSSNYLLVKNYKKQMTAAIGRSSFSFVGMHGDGSAASTLATIKANGLDYCVRFTDCDFSKTTPEDYLASAKSTLASLRGKARGYIDAHGNGSKYETDDYYKLLCDSGINVILVNKGLRLCQYIAENYSN